MNQKTMEQFYRISELLQKFSATFFVSCHAIVCQNESSKKNWYCAFIQVHFTFPTYSKYLSNLFDVKFLWAQNMDKISDFFLFAFFIANQTCYMKPITFPRKLDFAFSLFYFILYDFSHLLLSLSVNRIQLCHT